jgi:hypothetical protein
MGVGSGLEGDNDDPFDWTRAARSNDSDSRPGLGDSLVLARRRNAPAIPLNRKSSNGPGSSVSPGGGSRSAALSSLADLPSL